MNTFKLHLQDAAHYERIDQVAAFTGEDSSGSFTLWARHERFMTSLIFGLARFRIEDQWEYLALPGALLYFVNNELFLSTRRYFRDRDYERISEALLAQLEGEERQLQTMRESIHRMEQEMLKRLARLGRGETVGRVL